MDKYFLSRSAAQVYFLRTHNGKKQVLFGLRSSGVSQSPNLWDVAAGHCEKGESYTMAAKREAYEEFGVTFDEKDIIFTTVIHIGHTDIGYQYINAHFFVENYSGTMRIGEPDKCDRLQWFDIDDLPKNIFNDRREAVKNFIKGIHYSEIDWTV